MTPEMIAAHAWARSSSRPCAAWRRCGAPFTGVLFAGLMITDGRAEADRIQCPLRRSGMPGADAAAEGRSAGRCSRRATASSRSFDLRWRDDAALTVVMAANGYPGDYRERARSSRARRGRAGRGRRDLPRRHAPTAARIVANGGRVLNVTRARHRRSREAQARAYAARRPDRLAGGLLPPRHRLAGGGAGKGRASAEEFLCIRFADVRRFAVSGGAAAASLPALARMIFVVHGAATIDGKTLDDGEAWHGEGAASLTAGKDGVTLWRFELTASGSSERADRGGVALAGKTFRHARNDPAGRVAAARRQRRVSARRLRVPAQALGPGHPLPDRRRHPHRHPRPLDLLRPGQRLVRDRLRSRVRAGCDGPAEPLHPRHGAAARAARQKLVPVRQRRGQGEAAVQQYKIFTDMPIATPIRRWHCGRARLESSAAKHLGGLSWLRLARSLKT